MKLMNLEPVLKQIAKMAKTSQETNETLKP